MESPISLNLDLIGLCLLSLLTGLAVLPGQETPVAAPSGQIAGTALPRNDLFVRGDDLYHTYRIPALAVLGDIVLAVCEGRKDSSADAGNIDLVMRRSPDGGKTWEEPVVVYEEGGSKSIAIGSPCLVADPKTNIIHLLFTRDAKALFHMVTRDGTAWSNAVEITDSLVDFGYRYKKIGVGPGHGVIAPNGRIIVPIHVHNADLAHELSAVDNNVFRSGTLVSDDRGRTWRAGGLVRANLAKCLEPSIAIDSDGTVIVNMRAEKLGFRAAARSDSYGDKWSLAELVEGLPCPSCQGSIQSVNEGDKTWLAMSNPAVSSKEGYNARNRRRFTIRLSDDGGRTWPHSRMLHEGPAGYSDLATLPDGRILCLFENGGKLYHSRVSLVVIDPRWIRRE